LLENTKVKTVEEHGKIRKLAIGIYIPDWFYNSDESDKMFTDELIKTIKQSREYRPLRLNLAKLWIFSEKDAENFVRKNNLVAIVQHDSKFYRKNSKYSNNVKLLERHIPFFNSTKCQELGHNKIATKKVLREKNIPVLDDKAIHSLEELNEYLEEDNLYVVKPPSDGAGNGVKLIKKCEREFFTYDNGHWENVDIVEIKQENGERKIKIEHRASLKSPRSLFKKLFLDFTYHPMLVEPYFNDHGKGFSSLRCTVIGDMVVEAVKRTNFKNITSNIARGGSAKKFELSNDQKTTAIAVKNAVGAEYAGVDFLIRGEEWVIGEINIGPFTLFSKYTGVNVGKILGEHLIKKCDELRRY